MSATLRAVCFDFDGLILDTESACFGSWQWLFREHGHEYPLVEYLRIVGSDYGENNPRLLLDRQVGRSLDWSALDVLRHEEERRLGAHLVIKPGIRELVAEATRLGLKRAVVSSSTLQWVRGHLDRHGLLASFHLLVTREDAARVKPAPDLYLEAARRLEIEPHEAIAFEDSHNGSLAARRAGLRCVAVPNEVTASQDFAHADARVESLAGLDLADLARGFGLHVETAARPVEA
ncbi:HAD family hydrolase [Opitutales bacterium ASA1]|uniref:HAD family hydrolase n=1 Tax=Congregicoccus parvus TaxID=3081749 RepID=UPI002B29E5DF|nr:HAD family hydrolase [Opitutales bacterium ASA1]